VSLPTGAQLDHLVIAARTLDEGVAWCEATLGVVPGPGGEHALFGTHNLLLRLNSEQAPRAYLEIIAINPTDTPTRPAGLKRWFDLDDLALQTRLAQHGPQLVHWVASVPDIDEATRAWNALGIDRGPAIAASRPTPSGLLQWRITVRDDGQRLFGGALPTLIQWGGAHPTDTLPISDVTLCGLSFRHPEADRLQAALSGIGLADRVVTTGPAALTAELTTPLCSCTLRSN
jgi:hypothetical protein